MRRPGLIFANSFANGRKCLTLHRLLALGPSAQRSMPCTGSRGLDSARTLFVRAQKMILSWLYSAII